MNLLKPLLLAYLRHSLTIASGYLLAHGLIQQTDQQVVISASLALAGVAWTTVDKLLTTYELQKTRVLVPGIANLPIGSALNATQESGAPR